jgi:hypothetical protein
MTRKTSSICMVAVCALFSLAASSLSAATIIKLNLGGIGPDVEMPASPGPLELKTRNDAIPATTGDQNTDVEFVGILDGNADITTTDASFTLSGLTPTPGPATSFPPLMIQNFTGGSFTLYAPNNSILLSGTLANSALTGVVGPLGGGTGALFTTTFGSITGGSLSAGLVPSSLTLSMNLSGVNGGNGFALSPNNFLLPFVADASVNISADVPEPAAMTLVLIGLAAAACSRRRR